MGFSRKEYWSGLSFPSPWDLPDPGIEPRSPTLQADALTFEAPGKPSFENIFSNSVSSHFILFMASFAVKKKLISLFRYPSLCFQPLLSADLFKLIAGTSNKIYWNKWKYLAKIIGDAVIINTSYASPWYQNVHYSRCLCLDSSSLLWLPQFGLKLTDIYLSILVNINNGWICLLHTKRGNMSILNVAGETDLHLLLGNLSHLFCYFWNTVWQPQHP